MKITGVPPLDGDYDIDVATFKHRELHLLKQETGVRAGELEEAFMAGDSDLIIGIALIVLLRHGKGSPEEIRGALWDSDLGSVTLIGDQEAEGDDALPPPNGPVENSGDEQTSGPSGLNTKNGSGSRAAIPSPTGSPPSDTSAI